MCLFLGGGGGGGGLPGGCDGIGSINQIWPRHGHRGKRRVCMYCLGGAAISRVGPIRGRGRARRYIEEERALCGPIRGRGRARGYDRTRARALRGTYVDCSAEEGGGQESRADDSGALNDALHNAIHKICIILGEKKEMRLRCGSVHELEVTDMMLVLHARSDCPQQQVMLLAQQNRRRNATRTPPSRHTQILSEKDEQLGRAAQPP